MIGKLKNYRKMMREIDQINDQIKEIETKLYSPKSPQITGMPKGGTFDETDVIIKYLELQKKAEQKLKKLMKQTVEINDALEKLPIIERQVLRYRYIFGLTIKGTAEAMSYSERQVVNLTNRGIKLLRQ